MFFGGHSLTTFGITNLLFSNLELEIASISCDKYVIGKSDHHKFQGGGIAVPN